jgi:hypothetical protein
MAEQSGKIESHSEKYEEYDHIPQWLGWIILLGLSFFILSWGMLLMMLVVDTPRRWDFGALPDTPAESVYASQQPWSKATGPQVAPLPEARSLSTPAEPGAVTADREGR